MVQQDKQNRHRLASYQLSGLVGYSMPLNLFPHPQNRANDNYKIVQMTK